MVSSVSSNQNSHAGLKVGLGVAALGGVSTYSTSKLIDASTAFVANTSRKIFAENTNTIKDFSKTLYLLNKLGSTDEALKDEIANKIKQADAIRINTYKDASKMFAQRKEFKNINMKKSLAIAVPFYLAAGAIVDFANNRQRAKSEANAETKNGNPYVKVNMGKKLGGFLGLACEGGILGINKAMKNCPRIQNPLLTTALSVTGGFILGALADKCANRAARKQADKMA